MLSAEYPDPFGLLYICIGIFGSVCNLATALIIIRYRVYRLSAYTIMANIAIADTIILIFAGLVCGSVLLQTPQTSNSALPLLLNSSVQYIPSSKPVNITTNISNYKLLAVEKANNEVPLGLPPSDTDRIIWKSNFNAVLSFFGVAAWITNGFSYAFLGLNRCVAICYFHTQARVLNTVKNALIGSFTAWFIGIVIVTLLSACVATFPEPIFSIRRDLWTVSIVPIEWKKQVYILIFAIVFNGLSIMIQLLCSTLVLTKIRTVKRKINANALKKLSAFRFLKQAELTLQFFYPSVVCTTATLVYLTKPFIVSSLPNWVLILKHVIWLLGHSCNPLIYAYYNECMRESYRSWLTCLPLRMCCRRPSLPRPSIELTTKFRKATHHYAKKSIIRSSLQVQSRNFEQLCQFMMKINPSSDTNEGWIDDSYESENEL